MTRSNFGQSYVPFQLFAFCIDKHIGVNIVFYKHISSSFLKSN